MLGYTLGWIGVSGLLLVPIGLLLLIFGSGARVTDRTCSCGYDLSRLSRRSRRCPECGAPRRHVTVAHPRLQMVALAMVITPVLAIVLLVVLFTIRVTSK